MSNSNKDDGIIKYNIDNHTQGPCLSDSEYQDLECFRHKLYQLKLIGEYLPERIGYGNLSLRHDYQKLHPTDHIQFIITGTQTGGRENLTGCHYTRVLDFSFQKWAIKDMGPIQASSEALTHAAIYESAPEKIKAVFHIHNKDIWNGMITENYNSTPADIPYGTEEMAFAVEECVAKSNQGIIVMKGHEDGVISYGATMQIAMDLILEVYTKFCK